MRLVNSLATFAILLAYAHAGGAEISLVGELDLYKPSGGSPIDQYDVSRTFDFEEAEAGFKLTPTLSGVVFDGQATARFEIEGFVRNKKIGFRLVADASGAEALTSANVVFKSTDGWRLNPRSTSSKLPNMHLKCNFVLSATASSSGPSAFIAGQPLTFELFGGFAVQSVSISRDFLRTGGDVQLNHALGLKLSNVGDMQGDLSLAYKVNFLFGEPRRVEIDSLNSLTLESITFDDGSTPEDHGFDIIFDSGRRSPNLPIPEPTSGLMLATCLAMAASVTSRTARKRGSTSRPSDGEWLGSTQQ